MKNIHRYIFILFIGIFLFTRNVWASDIYIDIEKEEISIDNNTYKSITKYDSLKEFLNDYNNNSLPEIYMTNFLFDGVSSVKSPDLDDFIENNSNDAKIKTLSIDVLNINTTGNIELTGTRKGFMVAVNTNNYKKDINIILNNVNIDTDTKKAPAIYVYNKDIDYTACKVTIKTKENSNNYIEGGKFKKVSLMVNEELDNYKKYYNNESLTNYELYTNYYGIYNKEEIDNILFAKVYADNEDLQDGDPYVFYKASGAISSDIDLYFEGEGYLSVTSKNKEGIETKGNLIFSGGTGDYVVFAKDDCINTTTSKNSSKEVRNSIIIDVNSMVLVVDDDGDEGDAIDSNGTLTINGGNIYAFAHSTSGDSGLDSEDGTYINGGTIIATGNMADKVSESKQKYIYVNFNSKIEKDTLIVIKNENNEIIMAFKTSKDIKTLFYSSEDLDYKSYKIYSGKTITGNQVNGLYTNIESYETDEELSFTEVNNNNIKINNKDNNFILNLLITETSLLLILIIYLLIDKYLIKREAK